MMKSRSLSLLLFFLLLATSTLSFATPRTTSKTQNPTTKPNPSHSTNPDTSLPGFDPAGGFSIPGFGNGNPFGNGPFNVPGFAGGWGGGSSGSNGGHASGGVVVPSVVCSDKGPCYKKRVTCPKKCFSSYSRSGKNYGAGGGGGGCTIDCKKRCIGYC
ncbi:uncharacterized protein LOC144572489 [Carex rostrata]